MRNDMDLKTDRSLRQLKILKELKTEVDDKMFA